MQQTDSPATVAVAGDATISHCALVAAALSRTPLRIEHLADTPEVRATERALHAFTARDAHIPCGDAAITAELLAGLCAGAGVDATLTGESQASIEPTAAQLRAFGASIETRDGRLPAIVRGARTVQTRAFILVAPTPATRDALAFAARAAQAEITIGGDRAPDDAERLLAYLDASGSTSIEIPGDTDAAGARLVDALLAGEAIRIAGVAVNPLRTGLLDVLAAMGASIEVTDERLLCGAPVADLTARPGALRGTTVAGDLLARSRSALPLLYRLAGAAVGETRILGRDLPDPETPFERLPNGIAFRGRHADT